MAETLPRAVSGKSPLPEAQAKDLVASMHLSSTWYDRALDVG